MGSEQHGLLLLGCSRIILAERRNLARQKCTAWIRAAREQWANRAADTDGCGAHEGFAVWQALAVDEEDGAAERPNVPWRRAEEREG